MPKQVKYSSSFYLSKVTKEGSFMSDAEALATLRYLCQINESDYATQLAKKNPQWGLKVINGRVYQKVK